MNDLISKQAVREALLKKGQSSKRYKLGETWELNWLEIEDALSSIPTDTTVTDKRADVEPVKHGHWITDDSKIYLKHKCSECGNAVILKYPYCENCGAEMDGGTEDGRKKV